VTLDVQSDTVYVYRKGNVKGLIKNHDH